MPEFIMPLGDKAKDFECLPPFVQGYIEAMFFTQSGPEEGELGDAGFADLAPEALKSIVADYHAFTEAAAPLLGQAFERGYQRDQAGRDFWYTRNGHGVGFWDRKELKTPVWGEGGPRWTQPSLGEQLSALCGSFTEFPEVFATRGDDGKVYLS